MKFLKQQFRYFQKPMTGGFITDNVGLENEQNQKAGLPRRTGFFLMRYIHAQFAACLRMMFNAAPALNHSICCAL